MSQPELARAVGISQPSMSAIETGATRSPTAAHMLRIAAVLCANPVWLVTGEGDSEIYQSASEAEWVEVLRSLDDAQRRAILAAAKALKGTGQ